MTPGEAPAVDVVVVGAGQAGLAVGHHLQRQGLSFVILERGDCVGGSWLRRWDSLTLFTPTRFSSLPGRPFPGDPDSYPRGTAVAAYLQDYASVNALPVRLSTSVEKVEKRGRFVVHTNHGAVDAAVVVVTTGAFQLPRVPAFSAGLAPSVRQLHTSDYRNAQQLPSGRVLVVGTGNSGLQVAAELAATHEVHLSAGSKQMALPRRVLGKDIFWWLDRLGFTRASLEKMPKWLAGDGDVLVGQTVKGTARRAGLALHQRTTGAAADRVAFEDGTDLQVDAVVWATGYRSDYSWLPVEATGDEGRPEHRRGVTPVEGLFFVGLENQYSSASSLLGWVQHDAGFIADQARAVVDEGVSAPGQPSAPSAG